MRRCKTATGSCKRPDRPCCADCLDKTCQARCWNSPKRCGCWTETDEAAGAVHRGPARKYDWGSIARLHAQGLPQKAIAAQLGCSASTVEKVLAKLRNGSAGT